MQRPLDHGPGSPSEPSDGELLHLWRSGLAEAGTALMRRHEHTLRRWLRPRFRDATDDLVQQTFLVCTQNLDRIHDAERFSSFMMGVARRVALHHARANKSRIDHELALGDEPKQSRETPSRVYVLHQREFHVMRAIERLPPEWQVAVVLHYWRGLSIAEVAQVQGVAEGTVKSWLARSRARLKRKLAILLPDLPTS